MLHLNQAETIERCTTARGELKLQRRHNDYEIISNGTFLVATYNGESERLLVDTAVDACSKQIGRLGVGYSLDAAVRHPLVAAVTVIEIEERIIAWNRRELAPFSGNALADPQTNIIHADLLEWLPQTTTMFDVIVWISIMAQTGRYLLRMMDCMSVLGWSCYMIVCMRVESSRFGVLLVQ